MHQPDDEEMKAETKFEIHNVSEVLVDLNLDKCLENSVFCKCARCVADIRAYALNQLAPRYVVTEQGEAMVRASALSSQIQADIITAIMSAVMQVGRTPRH